MCLLRPNPSTHTPVPEVIKFTVLVHPSLSSLLYTYVLSLSDPCQGEEKKDFKGNYAFSQCVLRSHALAQETLFRGSCIL